MTHRQKKIAVKYPARQKHQSANTTGGGWDVRPPKEYFDELLRVSAKQIIWGGNYFTDYLPPSKAFICWDKRCSDQLTNNFADCEYAWCSESLGVARVCRYVWSGMIQGNMKNKEDRIHPTQKPVALYKWLLTQYAKQGDIILDTHCGSASSLIACEDLGFDYVAFEIDETYYKESQDRLERHRQQMSIIEFIDDWRWP